MLKKKVYLDKQKMIDTNHIKTIFDFKDHDGIHYHSDKFIFKIENELIQEEYIYILILMKITTESYTK